MPRAGVQGCRILVVEDDALIGMFLEQVLGDLGCVIVGPLAELDAAMSVAAEAALDGAILDVTIQGKMVYPAAEILHRRGIPIVLSSGHGDLAPPPSLRDQPRMTKPFGAIDVEAHIRRMCARRA